MCRGMNDEEYTRLHERARANRPGAGYAIIRALLVPLLRVYFRPRITRHQPIPGEGALILASNHHSFSDSFFISLGTSRPLRWMAKAELFEPRWCRGLLLALGAFPVRRGRGDHEAMETARLVLLDGQALALFPGGTRRRDGLGRPRRGVARLALETGATVMPVSIQGTARLRRGLLVLPLRVDVQFGAGVAVERQEPTAEEADRLLARIWTEVGDGWHALGRRRALVAGIGGAMGALGALGAGITIWSRRRGGS